MAETQSGRSPLDRLVLFLVCLSVIGLLVAGGLWITVDRPMQLLTQAPVNSGDDAGQVEDGNGSCIDDCIRQLDSCYDVCKARHWQYDVIGSSLCKDWCMENIRKPCMAKC